MTKKTGSLIYVVDTVSTSDITHLSAHAHGSSQKKEDNHLSARPSIVKNVTNQKRLNLHHLSSNDQVVSFQRHERLTTNVPQFGETTGPSLLMFFPCFLGRKLCMREYQFCTCFHLMELYRHERLRDRIISSTSTVSTFFPCPGKHQQGWSLNFSIDPTSRMSFTRWIFNLNSISATHEKIHFRQRCRERICWGKPLH